jgi:hypothetical protein
MISGLGAAAPRRDTAGVLGDAADAFAPGVAFRGEAFRGEAFRAVAFRGAAFRAVAFRAAGGLGDAAVAVTVVPWTFVSEPDPVDAVDVSSAIACLLWCAGHCPPPHSRRPTEPC